jgi:hypothetical protein
MSEVHGKTNLGLALAKQKIRSWDRTVSLAPRTGLWKIGYGVLNVAQP